jgi:putative holliday junction resolvase
VISETRDSGAAAVVAGRPSSSAGLAPDTENRSGTVLAFDFGTRRIGVAVGTLELSMAHPLAPIQYDDNQRRFAAITALVEEWRPERFVVGCPGVSDDTPHPLAPAIRRFARRLHARFALPVELVEEALSSWAASRRLSEAGIPAREQKQRIDSMAACVILESWFTTASSHSAGTDS